MAFDHAIAKLEKRGDVALLTQWIDWAFAEMKAALPKAASTRSHSIVVPGKQPFAARPGTHNHQQGVWVPALRAKWRFGRDDASNFPEDYPK